MVDFAKIRANNLKLVQDQKIEERVRAERPSQLDIITYMMDECELDAWERQFFPSIRTWLLKEPCNRLSYKQNAKLQEKIKDWDIEDDIKEGYCYAGYHNDHYKAQKQREEQRPSAPSSAYAAPRKANAIWDNMDDDIPF